MDYRRILAAAAAIFVALGATSCKDDDDDTTSSDYLDGSISFVLPAFIEPGDVYTLTPTGVSRLSTDDCEDGLGYCWSIDPIATANDTVRYESDGPEVKPDYTLTVPDTLCTITVTCTAFANGYYSSSADVSSIIVRASGEERSLQGVKYEGTKVFKDARDGKEYRYTAVGDREWFVDNLAYESAGKPFFNAKAMTDVFGMYYTWDDAVKACPDGWRLPSNSDFMALHNTICSDVETDDMADFYGNAGDCMADAYLNETKLWEYWPTVKITNKTGLSMLPTGYAQISEDGAFAFTGSSEYFTCWVSDEYNAEKGCYRYIYTDKPNIMLGAAGKKDFATAIRCVRDSAEGR